MESRKIPRAGTRLAGTSRRSSAQFPPSLPPLVQSIRRKRLSAGSPHSSIAVSDKPSIGPANLCVAGIAPQCGAQPTVRYFPTPDATHLRRIFFQFPACDRPTTRLACYGCVADRDNDIRWLHMTRSAAAVQLSSEFNEFLFAPTAEDRHGMPLSVLSALARLGIDPWQEAAKLSGLSREAAIQRLTGLIAELPGGTSAHSGPATNVACLIGLLPRRAGSAIASRGDLLGVGAKPNSLAIAYAVFMVFALAAQLIAANHHPPVQVDKAHVRTTTIVVSPPMRPLGPDR
jgi:hypothetical protein